MLSITETLTVLKVIGEEFIAHDVHDRTGEKYIRFKAEASGNVANRLSDLAAPSHRLFEATARRVPVRFNSFRLRARSIGAGKYELKDVLSPRDCESRPVTQRFTFLLRSTYTVNLATLNGNAKSLRFFPFTSASNIFVRDSTIFIRRRRADSLSRKTLRAISGR